MYSSSRLPVDKRIAVVDKGLGFDFSDITDLVKTALPVGLNIFNQQMQLKQVKTLAANGYPAQSPGVYGQAYGILPMSQVMQPQPTFGGVYAQPSTGMSGSTMALMGVGALLMGLLAVKALK